MLSALASAFPKRPILLKDKTTNILRILALVLVCGAAGVGALVLSWSKLLPGIEIDRVIAKDVEELPSSRQAAAPSRTASSIQGKCKSTLFVLQDCDISLSYRDGKGASRTREISMMFLDLSVEDYSVSPVRSASNHDLVSVDLAVDTLWNRIGVMAFIVLFGLGMLAVTPVLLVKSLAVRRYVREFSGQILAPVVVTITSQTRVSGNNQVHYRIDGGTGSAKKLHTAFGKQVPFLLRPGGSQALGLTLPGHEFVFLLDEALTRLDISDAERQAIRDARDADAK